MATLPNKVKNLAPQDMKRAINAIIDVLDENQLHRLELSLTGDDAPANGEQLTYNSLTGKFAPNNS